MHCRLPLPAEQWAYPPIPYRDGYPAHAVHPSLPAQSWPRYVRRNPPAAPHPVRPGGRLQADARSSAPPAKRRKRSHGTPVLPAGHPARRAHPHTRGRRKPPRRSHAPRRPGTPAAFLPSAPEAVLRKPALPPAPRRLSQTCIVPLPAGKGQLPALYAQCFPPAAALPGAYHP